MTPSLLRSHARPPPSERPVARASRARVRVHRPRLPRPPRRIRLHHQRHRHRTRRTHRNDVVVTHSRAHLALLVVAGGVKPHQRGAANLVHLERASSRKRQRIAVAVAVAVRGGGARQSTGVAQRHAVVDVVVVVAFAVAFVVARHGVQSRVTRARASVVHARVACVRTRVRIDDNTGASPRIGPRASLAHATGESWVSRHRVKHE